MDAEQTLLILVRDLQSRIDNVRDSLSAEIKEVKASIEDKLDQQENVTNMRLSLAEKRLDEHEHWRKLVNSVLSWVFSGASISALVAFVFPYIKGFFGL